MGYVPGKGTLDDIRRVMAKTVYLLNHISGQEGLKIILNNSIKVLKYMDITSADNLTVAVIGILIKISQRITNDTRRKLKPSGLNNLSS